MYRGDIETGLDAIQYAEDLYRDARRDARNAWDVFDDAVDAFLDAKETADAKTLAKLKRKARLAYHKVRNATEREDYTRAYLNGVRDMVDALNL